MENKEYIDAFFMAGLVFRVKVKMISEELEKLYIF